MFNCSSDPDYGRTTKKTVLNYLFYSALFVIILISSTGCFSQLSSKSKEKLTVQKKYPLKVAVMIGDIENYIFEPAINKKLYKIGGG